MDENNLASSSLPLLARMVDIDGTPYMDCEFAVEITEGTAKCFDCGQEFAAGINDKLVCPFCGGKKLVPVSGRDLTLKEILAE